MAEIQRIVSIPLIRPVGHTPARVQQTGDSPDHHRDAERNKHDSVQLEDEELEVQAPIEPSEDDGHLDISA